MSLRHVLFISFTLVSIIPVIFLSFGVQRAALDLELQAVEEKHLIIAKNVTGSIERYLLDIKSAMNTFARNTENKNPSQEVVDLMYDLNFRNIWRLERDGSSHSLIHNKLFAHDDPLPEEASKYIINTVPANRNKIVVTGIMKDAHLEPVFFVARLTGKKSVLVGSVSIDYIREVQNNISFGKRGHAAIVDQYGHVMAHPHRQWVEESKDISFLPPVKKMKSGITGVTQFYTPAMEEDMIAGHTVVESVGWGVMIPQPVSELEEMAAYANYLALFVAGLGIIIASALSWWLSSYVTRPLKNIVSFTEKVAGGDISSAVPLERHFAPLEIHKLTHAFNRMFERLQRKTNELVVTTQRLRHAQNIARLGNWELDVESGNMWWSDEVYHILGLQKKDNPLPSLEDLTEKLSKNDRNAFMDKLALASVQKKPFSLDMTLTAANGKQIFAHQDVIIQRKTNGQGVCITGTIQDISERKKYENKLFYQAHYDTLTKLPNRQLFIQMLRTEIEKASNKEHNIPLLVLGLDHFKEVNETLGHLAGDEILILAAQRIKQTAGPNSVVARLGSDEYAIFYTDGAGKDEVQARAEKIINGFNSPFVVREIETILGASIGISAYPKDGSDALNLLQKADTALHEIKASCARGTVKEFSANMNEQVTQRMNIRSDLALAIQNDELELMFQPIVESMTGKVVAAEALLRWNHPIRGYVTPEVFIPLAEKTGYIRDIGMWALDTACKELNQWRKKGHNDIRICINLSLSQVQFGLDKKSILRTLEQYDLNTGDLCLEITESVIMADKENCLAWMNELKDIGVNFAIDDFGTGYSSLSYLVNLPVSSVKIDGSFVSNMLYGEKDATLIETIITLSKKLNYSVVAEGVETIEQRRQLVKYGCDSLQGHFFSKPLRSQEFSKYIELTEVKEALLKHL